MMTIENVGVALRLDDSGYVVSCRSKVRDGEWLAAPAPLVEAFQGTKAFQPISMTTPAPGRLLLEFGGAGSINISYESRPYGVVFEIMELQGDFTKLIFCDLRLKLDGIVGRAVGVVRGDEVVFGFQGLNWATDGGAKPLPGGSEIFGAGYREDGFVGMRWCVFSCRPEEVMNNIEAIERAEPGLPHLEVDGKWLKAHAAPRPHLLAARRMPMEVGVELARQSGFDVLYLLPDIYSSSGHYGINPDKVQGGAEGLRKISEKLAEFGSGLLMHSMSGQVTANDSYLSPTPDPRLLSSGHAVLENAVDDTETTLVFRQATPGFTKAAKYVPGTNMEAGEDVSGTATLELGGELICPKSFHADGDRIVAAGCERGAHHTSAAAHAAGAQVRSLVEYWGKGSFFPEPRSDLPEEIAGNLAETLRRCGAKMMSFDGLEALSYGENSDALNDRLMLEDSEAYNDPRLYRRSGSNRFVKRLFERSGMRFFGVSTVTHYNWHLIFSRGGGEITIDLRADFHTRVPRNAWAKRNLLDVSMGAHDIRLHSMEWGEATHPEDIDFLCTRAAANNATFDIFVYTATHGRQSEMLETMRLWLEARRAHALSPEQLRPFKDDLCLDAKITRTSAGGYSLTPVVQGKRYCLITSGPATGLHNPFAAQPAQFSLQMLPAFREEHPDNIVLPLDAATAVPDDDASVLSTKHMELRQIDGFLVFDATRRVEDEPRLARWICPLGRTFDLSANRGLEVVLDTDTSGMAFFVQLKDVNSMIRTYIWRVEAAGELRLFLPNGEISTSVFHDYDPWGKFSPWFSAMKTFAYDKVTDAAFGFTGLPVGRPCRARLKSVRALRELSEPARGLSFVVNGEETSLDTELRPFDYLRVAADGKATVHDPDWNPLREFAPPRQTWRSGSNSFAVNSPASDKHWLRLRPVFLITR